MNYSIRSTKSRPSPHNVALRCSAGFWFLTLRKLRRRCAGVRESGAFLLGRSGGGIRRIQLAVYYDDLDVYALDTGIIRFNSAGYAPLWRICEQQSLEVLADLHCHPGSAYQSESDRAHPMVPRTGHTALIIPNFAAHCWNLSKVGIYEYRGSGNWAVESPPHFVDPWTLQLGAGR